MNYIEMLKKSYNELIKNKKGNNVLMCDNINMFEYTTEKEINSLNKNKLHLDLIPQPILGNVHNAKIIICSLNPGYDVADYYMENEKLSLENKIPYYKNELINFMNQDLNNDFVFLNEKDVTSPVYKWWRSKLDCKNYNNSLVHSIVEEYNKNNIYVSHEDVLKMFSKILCTIELFPYHSKTINKKYLKNTESVRLVKEYLHSELIPNSSKNNVLICFTRSIKDWELTEEEKKLDSVNINNINVQNITFNPKYEFGRKIFNHIKSITKDFSILIN